MKNVAVLGARGFIGKNTVHYLESSCKYNVIAVTRDNVDLLNGEAVEEFLKSRKIDIIVHCANQGGTRKNQDGKMDVIGNNLKMFFNIERCLNEKIKFINFGSGAQYDKTRDLIKIKEEDFEQYIPKDDYGYSKYVMSKFIKNRSDNKNMGKIYNPIIFGMYGVGEDYTYRFISNAIIKNILKMPIEINQNVVFDYLYIEDYFRILERMLDEDWEECEFNVTPNDSISLQRIAEYINEVGMYKSEILIKNEGMNYQYTGDNSRLLSLLGENFSFTPYQKAIEKMYKYYYDNRNELNLDAVKEDALMKYCYTRDSGEKNER